MKIMSKIAEKAKNLPGEQPVTIAFLGDSITQGCFELRLDLVAGGYEPVCDYGAVYHAKLRQLLATLYPMAPINIINAGVNGSTTPGALARLERDVLRYSPDLVVVCLGMNDYVAGDEALEKFSQALDEIMTRLDGQDCEVIYMTPCCCPEHITKKLDPYCDGWVTLIEGKVKDGTMDRYMARALEICGRHDVRICDCYAKWKKLVANGVDITPLLSNSLNHPTRDMHWLFANSLLEVMLDD